MHNPVWMAALVTHDIRDDKLNRFLGAKHAIIPIAPLEESVDRIRYNRSISNIFVPDVLLDDISFKCFVVHL